MSDRPIIFSGSMVRAMLEGRKTMTRRLWIPQPPEDAEVWFNPIFQQWCWALDDYGHTHPYKVGDRLYVRENWRQAYPQTSYGPGIIYQADRAASLGMDEYSDRHKWKPSIHLPKEHSRLTLTVEAVKVERLQDISEEDAYNEGVEWNPRLDPVGPCKWRVYGKEHTGTDSVRHSFETLWQSLNAKRAPWESNPWCVAVTFRVHKCNIDRMPG